MGITDSLILNRQAPALVERRILMEDDDGQYYQTVALQEEYEAFLRDREALNEWHLFLELINGQSRNLEQGQAPS